MNNFLREDERKLTKKTPNILVIPYPNYFLAKEPFKKNGLLQKQFSRIWDF
jgi:hypothetical protein